MTTTTELAQRLTAAAEAFLDSRRTSFEALPGNADLDPEQLTDAWRYTRDQNLGMTRARIERWVERVPGLYRSATLDQLRPDQHPDDLGGYLLSPARNLLLAGPVGTGKSFAAWAVAHQATALDLRAAVYSTPRLLLDMRPDNDPGAFRSACTADLLVLDDLGAARPTEWAVEQMFSIAEERTSHQRRTVITTNATYEGLIQLWGQPTMDRFRDKSTHVVMGGSSLRGPA